MEIIVSEFISWQYFIILLLSILFILWIFWGGGDYEYIGYAPLKIGVNAAEINTKKEKKEEEDSDNFSEVEFSTSEDLSSEVEFSNTDDSFNKVYIERGIKFKPTREKDKIAKLSYSQDFINEPNTKNLVNPDILVEKEEKEEKVEEKEEKSPRSLALGEFSCYKNNKLSKGEAFCKQAIEEIYGVPFYCVRPNFLKNPETGRNLELDLYNDSLKIAVEYNGLQHSVFPNSFHKTYDEFINQVRRDQYKIDVCDKNGIYLITVPHTVPIEYEAIRSYIEYYLPENHAKRLNET